MRPDLTPAATRALRAASGHACAAGAETVEPLHLLLALVEEDEGKAANLLTRAGVSPAAVRAHFAAPSPATSPPSLTLASTTDSVVARARRLAAENQDEPSVSGATLLAAVLNEDASLRRTLETLGLDHARLEAEVGAGRAEPLQLDEPLHLTGPTEQLDTARVLDANLNRAREALRVIEDYCRFVLDDRYLSRTAKQLRHDLADLAATLPESALLAGRDTQGDVGTTLSTAREVERRTPLEVARANLKRLEEALRSLEEFGKLVRPGVGRAAEQLRYQAYTLERAIVGGAASRRRLENARLYVLVTGSQCHGALDWTIREAVAGGAGLIQLREKELDDRQLLDRARGVRHWTREAGVLFILNDRPDLARLAEADGVHLGQDDLSVREARRIMGPDALVGVSTHDGEQLRRAVLAGADYVGVGPTFASATKQFPALAGLPFVQLAAAETSLPAFAIGGISLDTIDAAVSAGARRVAVSGAVCRVADPRAAAAALVRRLPP